MPLRIYTDTSVIGGCLDREFAEDSTLHGYGILTIISPKEVLVDD